jgi:hypothetical protein
MLQAAKLGSFRIAYDAKPECQDLVESFIREANLSTRAFSDSVVSNIWVLRGVILSIHFVCIRCDKVAYGLGKVRFHHIQL